MQHALGQGRVLTTSMALEEGGESEEATPEGLHKGHEYGIVDVVTVGEQQLVILQNPWLCGEWSGAYSDKDEFWTKEPARRKEAGDSVISSLTQSLLKIMIAVAPCCYSLR